MISITPCTEILFPVDADPFQRYFVSCVEVVFRKSQLFLQVSFLLVQFSFESDGSLFDSVLLSAGQSVKSVSIIFLF